MRKAVNYFLSWVFVLAAGCCFAEADSLISKLNTVKEDTLKMQVLHELFLQYEYKDREKAKEFLDRAMEIAKRTGNKRGLGRTHMFMGYLAEDMGNSPEALANYLVSLKINRETGDKRGEAASYNNIGILYKDQENLTEALKNYNAALELYKQLGDKKAEGNAYNNIGNVYQLQGNLAEALKSHLLGLKLKKESGNKRGVADSYLNIGSIYNDQAALEQQAATRNSKLIQAEEHMLYALKLNEELDNGVGIAACYNDLGNVYTRQGNHSEAAKYLAKGKDLAVELKNKKLLKHIYGSYTVLESARKDYKAAFEYHKLFIRYRDSLDNEETRKKTIESQMTYDFEKKEAVAEAEHKKELEKQELLAGEKSRKQKVVLGLVSCFLLLVLFFAGFIFRSLRVTRKQKDIIERQKNIVEQQKQEVEQQKVIVEEHQKEIIDSITYARRIQYSLLPTEAYIDRNLKRLNRKIR